MGQLITTKVKSGLGLRLADGRREDIPLGTIRALEIEGAFNDESAAIIPRFRFYCSSSEQVGFPIWIWTPIQVEGSRVRRHRRRRRNTLTDFCGRTSGLRHPFWTGVHTQHL